MRQILAIVLAFASLLSNVEAWGGEACGEQAAISAAPCACCAQEVDCGCVTDSKKAPVQMPVQTGVRHEVPAYSGGLWSVFTSPAPDFGETRLSWMKAEQGMAHSSRHVPVFILHCAALC